VKEAVRIGVQVAGGLAAAHLGEKERAVDLLRESLARGSSYAALHTDIDLEPLHGYPPFEELMKPKG